MKDFNMEVMKGAIATAGLVIVTNINSILGAILTASSIAYLWWKWRVEYKKNKKENERKN
jgi:hypothetical protein